MRRHPGWQDAVRAVVVTAVLWGSLVALGRAVRLVPGWPPGAIAGCVALAAELLIFLYRYESVSLGKSRSRFLVALRLTALAVLAWILIEPTYVHIVTRRTDRQVAVLWDASASMDLIDDGAGQSRAAIGRDAVTKSGILKQLGKRVRLSEYHFARSPENDTTDSTSGWNQSTDIAAALDNVLEQVPPDELAGVLLLTDGRHNRPSNVETSARRFGILDAPVGIVAIGNPVPPHDAAILAVRAPDAVHLGDRMRVTADLKFEGYRGTKAKVRFTCGGKLLEEKEVAVAEDRHNEELTFVHRPEQGGTSDYQVEISPLPGERMTDNNRWSFETSITDARTNVLLVDTYPRWEFRYLRNLFYGRDKSVHLQWLLLQPEQAEGQDQPDIAASAARPFGQSAATRLPVSEAEWRKFDVIILGDLPAEAINDATWSIISRCVNERGALLVFVAGPNHMPHALTAAAARELLPVDPGWSQLPCDFTCPPFRLSLTSEGRHHPVTHPAIGGVINEQVWSAYPPFQWRHPVVSVKDGAEILLCAAEDTPAKANASAPDNLNINPDNLFRQRESEAKRALLVTRQTGHGKVAALLTDRTWRLREGAGDIHHHRFWGNLVRWGAGPLLRAGSNKVALGTDQLTYTTDDPLIITARLRDANLNPLADSSLCADILKDGKVVATIPLTPIAGTNGLHEGRTTPARLPGSYTIRLAGPNVGALLASENKKSLATSVRVIAARVPVELVETTMNRPLLETVASASGGKVVAPAEIASLFPLFLSEGTPRLEVRETPLWDNAVVFAVLAVLLTTEWWLRRNGGLP